MKHLLSLLCGLLVSGPLCAIEIQGKVITLNDEEFEVCQEEGGCFVITVNGLRDHLKLNVSRALVACKNST